MEDLGLSRAFWQGRRVLLTGHTGFKGSWLLLLLESLGAEVTGISLKPPANGLFEQISGATHCEHHIVDIRDYSELNAIIADANPEIVLHLAAQPLVRRSYVDPLESIATNVMGTANLLQAVRNVGGVLAIVSVTTDKCYANDGRTAGYREYDRLGGHDPYSSSKACAELVTQCFRDSYFAPRSVGVATARAGNVIGGGDYSSDRLFPDVVRALTAGRQPELRNPAAVRPWQHVLEPLTGYCLLAEHLAADPQGMAKGWNFGPAHDDMKSVSTVIRDLARHWGHAGDFNSQLGIHPHEADVLRLDSSMARRVLGWRPRLSLATAIEWTAEWYQAQRGGVDARDLCLSQIGRYFASDVASAAAA